MESFNFDKLDSSNEQPLKELIDQVKYDTFNSAYDCIKEMGLQFLVEKGSKRPKYIINGLINYFQHPDREEYEKCAVLLKAAKSYVKMKKDSTKLKKSTK